MCFGFVLWQAVYLVTFIIEKESVLIVINAALAGVYLLHAFSARRVHYFMQLFISCGIAIFAHTVIHQILLGPTFGFQYMYLAAVPIVFYMNYVRKKKVRSSVNFALGILGVFVVTEVITTLVDYPIFSISRGSWRLMALFNMFVAFAMDITFLSMFVWQATKDNGTLRTQNSDLMVSANIDTLTGLRNRRSVEAHLNRAFAQARGEGKDFTLFMCDIDNFKRVNDTYGHDCGDLVLKNVANIFVKELRPEDVVFRWGGEEILVLIYGGEFCAAKVAERCRSAIEESEVHYKDQTIKVTITIGGATYFQGSTKDKLIEKADANLYKGKNNGKNQVVM